MAISRGKLLRVSSEDKRSGQTNSDFTVLLNNTSFIQNVRGVLVKSLSFKNIFPNIYEGNNKFTFEYETGGVGQILTVEIPVAWYDSTSFTSTLETAINALPEVLNPITVNHTIIPTGASSLNKKLVFTASGADKIALANKDDGNLMADVCGILQTSALATSVTADALLDLGGLSVAYLCSNDIAGSNSAASSNGGENVSVITEIPINAPFGGQVYYRANNENLESIIYPNERSLTKVSIQLCTRSGRILDLQQHNLTVLFKIIPSGVFPKD
jgi:hypothetical protein